MAKQLIQLGREAAREHACNYRHTVQICIVMVDGNWDELLTNTARCAGKVPEPLCNLLVMWGADARMDNQKDKGFSEMSSACPNPRPVSYTHLRAHETGRNL